ncbi:MAG: D-alanyl-D-alanine carboxypeptidase [Proteobacteria bacterium]|nr:MAG: D-alanyl-D-alanine carboxypeptidase [Pseudomonadota bacterium]
MQYRTGYPFWFQSMKGAILWLTMALLVVGGSASPTLAAKRTPSAIVINEATGEVYFARGADRQGYPASLTKVMTLYLVFDALKNGGLTLDRKLPVSPVAAGRSPTKLWLAPGSTITVREAILALVTLSANDAATVLAEAMGGTERQFAKMMTARAHELGMTQTRFMNASGLPNSAQVSTPRDMAKLGVAIRRDFPEYYTFFSTREFRYNGRTYRNHNRLLGNFQGVDGIKTGYTAASGFNLVSSAERDGTRLVGVVFGGNTAAARDAYMRSILTNAFDGQGLATMPPKVLEASIKAPSTQVDRAVYQGRQWGIQVGAFRNYGAAQRLAESAITIVPAGEQLSVKVAGPGKKTRKPLYRARLIGFSTIEEARKACDHLKQNNFGCLPVSL